MSFSPYSPGVASSCSKSRCTGPISAKPTRCTTRGWRNVNGVAATQPTTTTTIEPRRRPRNRPSPSRRARRNVVEVAQQPGGEHQRDVDVMKNRNHTNTRKCSERASWMLNRLLIGLNRVDSAGDMPSPVINASGAAMKMVMK